MAKNILGIDIGHSQLKLALVNGTAVKKVVTVDIPENLVLNGRVTSVDAMAILIKDSCKKYGLSAKLASISVPDTLLFEREVNMPKMSAEQLLVNIPYEFKMYITDELQNYYFDYAMATPYEELVKKETTTMDLLAVAILKSLVEEYKLIVRKAGMKLVKVVPAVCTFQNLIRSAHLPVKEYCILDLGYRTIRLMMYQNDIHKVTKQLEIGTRDIAQIIADHYNIDIYLAQTYFLSNYDNCQEKEFCREAYRSIAVELQRAIKFYQFSNRDSELNDMWMVGNGVCCKNLVDEIVEGIDLVNHDPSDFVAEKIEDGYLYAEAIGSAIGGVE